MLVANAARAKEKLGWVPTTPFEQLVKEMIESDYTSAKRDSLVKLAGFQAVVRWHWSQAAVVGMWPLFLPVAVEPLWHVAHEPGVTLP